MDYMSTNFGAQAVFLSDHRQTDRRDWTPYSTPVAIQPVWVKMTNANKNKNITQYIEIIFNKLTYYCCTICTKGNKNCLFKTFNIIIVNRHQCRK